MGHSVVIVLLLVAVLLINQYQKTFATYAALNNCIILTSWTAKNVTWRKTVETEKKQNLWLEYIEASQSIPWPAVSSTEFSVETTSKMIAK